MRRYAWLTGIVCLAVISACAQSGELERSGLVKDPAVALRMPGADQLGHVGGERIKTLDGEQEPFEGYIFGTAASTEEVFAFYEQELGRLGWKPNGSAGMSTVELDVRWWCSPKISFRLGIEDKARAYQPGFYKGKSYTTVFDARLLPYGGTTCPRPSPPPYKPR